MNQILRHLVGRSQPYPPEHRSNFIHLYFDVVWWGMLNGSILVFLGVYMSRLGATSFQVGLLTSIPALVNLVFTFPTNLLARGRSTQRLTCWSHLISRLFYALLVPLPVLLAPGVQIWVIVGIILLMNIPMTMAVVIGNAFFAEATPPEWRAHVVGVRNALLAASTVLTTLLAGRILKWLPFAQGYLMVFLIGFVGSMISVWHLFRIRLPSSQAGEPLLDPQEPARTDIWRQTFRWEIWRSPFATVLGVMFFLHLAFWLPIPISPLYQVQYLKLSDQTISLGSSMFWVVYFLGSTQSGGLSHRWGFKNLTGLGTILIAVSTLMFMFSTYLWLYLLTQLFSGLGWALLGGGLFNYLLEKIPPHDRSPYLAWFNLAVNAAVLLCGVLAPQMSEWIGLFWAMGAGAAAAFLAGMAVLRWG